MLKSLSRYAQQIDANREALHFDFSESGEVMRHAKPVPTRQEKRFTSEELISIGTTGTLCASVDVGLAPDRLQIGSVSLVRSICEVGVLSFTENSVHDRGIPNAEVLHTETAQKLYTGTTQSPQETAILLHHNIASKNFKPVQTCAELWLKHWSCVPNSTNASFFLRHFPSQKLWKMRSVTVAVYRLRTRPRLHIFRDRAICTIFSHLHKFPME